MTLKITFTGGGTAGHVTPNIALIHALKNTAEMTYIGSFDGVEKKMISELDIPYHAVHSGKLRRYFSWQNFIDPVKVLLGVIQSYFILRKIKPDVVFSKGGFVALPVVMGAYLNKIPVVAHESDMTPGLANRLTFPFVSQICVTFDAAKNYFKDKNKVRVTGTPIRQALFEGVRERGLERCGFALDKPCILVVGGSLGSRGLNAIVRSALHTLTKKYQVIHLCGPGHRDEAFNNPHYFQLEYANEELPDLLAASTLVISRSGANALYELLALGKPHILIPLSRKVSRGDQIQNAVFFQKQGVSIVLDDDTLTPELLTEAIEDAFMRHEAITTQIKALHITSATDAIVKLLSAKAYSS